jgi:peptide-methionine (S)-S-oxide reductase
MNADTGSSVENATVAIATLAGGCFWCLEAVFELVVGVKRVESGYTGGHVTAPSYEEVCSETTGHAEVVQITFDSDVVDYKELLEIFFSIHDPTTLNRQGPDEGSRYRSAIFYHNAYQKSTAETVIKDLSVSGIWVNEIVTDVVSLDIFYSAEGYHQEYYRSNTYQPYCQFIIAPKVAKFREKYLSKLKV